MPKLDRLLSIVIVFDRMVVVFTVKMVILTRMPVLVALTTNRPLQIGQEESDLLSLAQDHESSSYKTITSLEILHPQICISVLVFKYIGHVRLNIPVLELELLGPTLKKVLHMHVRVQDCLWAWNLRSGRRMD